MKKDILLDQIDGLQLMHALSARCDELYGRARVAWRDNDEVDLLTEEYGEGVNSSAFLYIMDEFTRDQFQSTCELLVEIYCFFPVLTIEGADDAILF